MKKITVPILLLVATMFATTSCTDNQRARNFGGSEKVEIPKGQVFVNATWKDDDMWIVTKDTSNGDFHFYEKSSWGLIEGDITFTHTK